MRFPQEGGTLFADLVKQISLCDQCNACVAACPTARVTGKEAYAPPFRLSVAGRVFAGEQPAAEACASIYSCPQCGACERLCPQEIKVSEIMNACRRKLVIQGVEPLEKQRKVMDGLQEKGNSVNGDPDKRWEWLPEAFPGHESDTLFYAGCLPAYLVKNSARSSYLVLKALGVDFMMDKAEDCCGIYYYNAGRWDLAEEKFAENLARFRRLGISRVITTCAGCFYCFKYYYSRLLEDWNIDVQHVTEILPPLVKNRRKELRRLGKTATFVDSCRLGRKEGLCDEPREVLDCCGVTVLDMAENRENGACCGAGAGMRSTYPELSRDLALWVLDHAPAQKVITACPFCSFNLSYAARKGNRAKDVVFITDVVLEALS